MAHAIARFEHLAHARPRPAWAYPLFAGCVGFTGLLLFAMWAKSIWATEQLERPKMSIDLRIAPEPPPAPPPPPGGAKPVAAAVIVPKRPTVKDIVQPVRIEKPIEHPQVAEVEGAKDGKDGGTPGGTNPDGPIDGAIGGKIETPPRVIVDKIPAKPPIVPPSVLETSRTSGDPQIVPDDVTKTEIQRSGKDRLVGTFKVCIDTSGTVSSVAQLKSTGFAAYDSRIASTIRETWRYRPLLIDGSPAAVCTAVTFVYSQR
ncbi:MAG TPA: hypothetical protein VMJ10_13900 [Kofleriaceae bacterium]|nr:hypothetical protein [Kofleriaceae bacterium]